VTGALIEAAPPDGIESAIAQLRAGRPVVVVDDAAREDEGDLIFAAEMATPELVSFVVRHTSGFLCVSLSHTDADRLDLPPMHRVNQDRHATAYAVSVDAREGVSTGISAHDRAATLRLLADPATRAADLSRPGHVVPLRARHGGVLSRAGHTEAAMDLMAIAGLRPAAGLCEIVSVEDPTRMARGPELQEFCAAHGLVMISIESIIDYRLRTEWVLSDRVCARLPLEEGTFSAVAYHTTLDDREHVALVHGELDAGENVLVRVQEECIFADVFGSLHCACRPELDAALDAVARERRGVVVYLRRHEGQVGAALDDITAAGYTHPRLAQPGRAPIDPADVQVCAQILADLGVRSIRLLGSHDGGWRHGLERHGLRVTEERPLRRGTPRRGTRGPVVLRSW
jgi:3,4-dihydroxy 2-butanone 4-phosphate synthase / GTP cyclohydrolase II